jgi:PAS domain S-box-containing protein
MQIGLGAKISLLTSILVFFSIGILGNYLYQTQRGALIDKAVEGSKGQVRLEAVKLNESILSLVNDVRFLAKMPPIQGIIRASANNGVDPVEGSSGVIWRERLETIFKAFLSEKKQYMQVRYIGQYGEGKEIVRVDLKNGEPHIAIDSELQTKGNQTYFKEAIKLSKGGTYLSPITLNREHGTISFPHIAVLRAAVPIYDANEKIFGIVVINMDIGSIFKRLIEQDEHIAFINDDGDYLGHQNPELNFGFELGKRHRVQDTYPEIAYLFEEGNTDNDFFYVSKKSNQDEAIFIIKTQYGSFDRKHFIALIHIEKISAIISQSKSVVNKTLLLVFALIVISVYIGLYFSRRLTSPLKQISLATAHFATETEAEAEAEAEFHLPTNLKDEIGDLARSFAAMIKKVAVRTSELKFQKDAIDQHAIVSLADVNGDITYVNDKLCQISGYSRDELMGKNHRILKSWEHPPEFFGDMWKTISSGKVWHGILKNKNKGGGYYWVHTTIVPNLNDDGEPFEYIGIRTEITENKRLEEELRLITQENEQILKSAGEGIYGLDLNGYTTFVNPAAEKLLGYSLAEMKNKSQHALIHHTKADGTPYHREECSIYAALKDGVVHHTLDDVFWRKDGSSFPVEYISTPILKDGEVAGAVVTFKDISEQKTNEVMILNARREAEEANKAKSLFLANMSHEIRTPMNAILGYSQILLRRKDLHADIIDSIRTIDTSGKNLLTMINEILDISKIEAGKMEINPSDFALNGLIDNISSLFELRCKQKRLQWTIKGLSSPTFVRADEGKLRQVLVNLLGNAVKFTESGEIILSITAREDNQYRFDIIDTGNGIPLEAQDKIFEAFQQDDEGEKVGGTGLGLAISKKQVELMGSELLLKSEVNEGSKFYFTLTLPPAEMEAIPDRRGKHRDVLHLASEYKVRALVVDDIKDNRDVLAKLLLDIGVEVFEAENGKEGVEKTKEHQPDIVFMDMRMPVMRGEDAIKLILEEFGKDRIKIVSITASALDRQRDFYIDMGCHEFITKPFMAEQIYSCLEELLDIEFVYDDDEVSQNESSSIEELDLSQISIPEDLYEKLKKSAELYNITSCEKTLKELQERDGGSKQLLEHLVRLIKNYDMEAIIKVLEDVSKTKD